MGTFILAVRGGGLSNLCLCLCVCVCVWGREWTHSCAGGTGLVERAVINSTPMLAGLLTVDLSAFRWRICALGTNDLRAPPRGPQLPQCHMGMWRYVKAVVALSCLVGFRVHPACVFLSRLSRVHRWGDSGSSCMGLMTLIASHLHWFISLFVPLMLCFLLFPALPHLSCFYINAPSLCSFETSMS